jgi:hypothetical protein
MIAFRDKLVLSSTLAALFGSGLATGYFLAKPTGLPVSRSEEKVPAAAGDWWQRSRDRLAKDLSLTPEQQRLVEPMLEHSSEQIFHNRDRALFQIHLELLAFHRKLDQAEGLLDGSQRRRVADLEKALRQEIEKQFPQFLKDNPLRTAAQVVP